MKLNRLKIISYKNLHDIEVDFSTCRGLAVVAGRNGAGKSNFLEALSLIMCDLNHIGVDMEVPFYEIEFQTEGRLCIAKRTSHETRTSWLNTGELEGKEVSQRLKTIAMYCGEFKRLLGCGYYDKHGWVDVSEMMPITDEDFAIAVLTMLMKKPDAFADILEYRPETLSPIRVSYQLANPHRVGEEGPESEVEDIVYALSNAPQDEETLRYEMAFKEFSELFLRFEMNARTLYWILSRIFVQSEYDTSFFEITISFADADGNSFTSDDLSEGEKRLIVLRAIYEFLADDNSLVLLDEPDAYVHESKKLDVYDMISGNAKRGVVTIMTTHSPLLVNYVSPDSLVALLREGDHVRVEQGAALSAITDLTDSRMAMFSTKPLLVFEGKSDMILFKKAVRYFRENESGYEGLRIDRTFDCCIVGGTGNAKYLYCEFRKMFPGRLMYFAFDNDDAGIRALNELTCPDPVDETFRPLRKLTGSRSRSNESGAFLIPRPDGIESKVYTMEDYLPPDFIQEWMTARVQRFTSFQTVVDLKATLKRYIGSEDTRFKPRDLRGFKPLIDFVAALMHGDR